MRLFPSFPLFSVYCPSDSKNKKQRIYLNQKTETSFPHNILFSEENELYLDCQVAMKLRSEDTDLVKTELALQLSAASACVRGNLIHKIK